MHRAPVANCPAPGGDSARAPAAAGRPSAVGFVQLLMTAAGLALWGGGCSDVSATQSAESVASIPSADSRRPTVAAESAPLPFPDDIGAVSVLIFTRTDCPIANRYAPEIVRLFETFAPQDVRFYLVYLDRRESQESIDAHQLEFKIPIRSILDPDQRLADATGATVTPEAVVFSRSGRQVYRGRIDDRYVDFGRARSQPTRTDLRDVLNACISDDAPPDQIVTPAVGCRISDLR